MGLFGTPGCMRLIVLTAVILLVFTLTVTCAENKKPKQNPLDPREDKVSFTIDKNVPKQICRQKDCKKLKNHKYPDNIDHSHEVFKPYDTPFIEEDRNVYNNEELKMSTIKKDGSTEFKENQKTVKPVVEESIESSEEFGFPDPIDNEYNQYDNMFKQKIFKKDMDCYDDLEEELFWENNGFYGKKLDKNYDNARKFKEKEIEIIKTLEKLRKIKEDENEVPTISTIKYNKVTSKKPQTAVPVEVTSDGKFNRKIQGKILLKDTKDEKSQTPKALDMEKKTTLKNNRKSIKNSEDNFKSNTVPSKGKEELASFEFSLVENGNEPILDQEVTNIDNNTYEENGTLPVYNLAKEPNNYDEDTADTGSYDETGGDNNYDEDNDSKQTDKSQENESNGYYEDANHIRKKKIVSIKKYRHEKNKNVANTDDNVMKIHGIKKRKYQNDDEYDKDSDETDIPKRFYINVDEDY